MSGFDNIPFGEFGDILKDMQPQLERLQQFASKMSNMDDHLAKFDNPKHKEYMREVLMRAKENGEMPDIEKIMNDIKKL